MEDPRGLLTLLLLLQLLLHFLVFNLLSQFLDKLCLLLHLILKFILLVSELISFEFLHLLLFLHQLRLVGGLLLLFRLDFRLATSKQVLLVLSAISLNTSLLLESLPHLPVESGLNLAFSSLDQILLKLDGCTITLLVVT